MGGFSDMSGLLTSGSDASDPFSDAYLKNVRRGDSSNRVPGSAEISADFLNLGGMNALKRAFAAFTGPLNYYSKLLGGDRQEMLQAVAPEVNAIRGQGATGRRALSQFAPRGGGTTSALAEEPFRESGAITDLLNKVRPEAAKGLTDLGALLGNIGIGELGTGENALANVMNYILGKSGQNLQFGQDIGQSLGLLLGVLATGV